MPLGLLPRLPLGCFGCPLGVAVAALGCCAELPQNCPELLWAGAGLAAGPAGAAPAVCEHARAAAIPPCRVQYADEVPEWKMEKNRYYCELPGDVWEEGELMRLIKDAQEKRVGGYWE